MPKSDNRRKKPRQERRKKTTKNTQLGYRGISRMQEQPYPAYSDNACPFPDLFHGAGCCICGHEDAQECPCGPLEALVHLERVHPTQDSERTRGMLGCPITGSDPAPRAAGQEKQGMFEAPCGSMVGYMTTADFPTMGHYRWHAIYDHLEQGACDGPDSCCVEALRTGAV